MADLRRFGPMDFVLLLLVLASAACVRAGYLSQCADGGRNGGPLRVQDARPPIPDLAAPDDMRGAPRTTDLDALIHNIREHTWFGCLAPFAPKEEATAHTSPGYPWLLGLAARYVPEERFDSSVRWAQCGLGALTAALYYLFARRAFRSLAVGTLAGLVAAVYPFWVIDTAAIDDGTLTTFLMALVVFLGGLAGERGGALTSLLFGLSLAGLALVRAALLPFSFVAIIWFLLRSRSLSRGWVCALLAFLGFANGLAPWTVRNVQLFGEPFPVVDSTYLHLWVGNNPQATGGPATEEMWQSAPAAELRKITKQPERYARLGAVVREEVRRDPVATVQRRGMAALYFVFGARWFPEEKGGHGTLAEVTPEGEAEMPAWLADAYPMALQATLLGLLALGFLGWRWSYGWRWESMPLMLAVVWVPLPYILGHAEGLSGPRLPLDGALICYAAVALVGLVPGLNSTLLDPPNAGQEATPAME